MFVQAAALLILLTLRGGQVAGEAAWDASGSRAIEGELFEGDIVAERSSIEQAYGAAFAEEVLGPGSGAEGITNNRRYLWPDGKVIYAIKEEQFVPAQIEYIHEVIRGMNETFGSTINFFKRSNETAYVIFARSGSGCYSVVGRTGKAQTINLGTGCLAKKVIQHEMLHTMGVWHEQSRPDRDDYVVVNYDNIATGKAHNFAKRTGIDSRGYEYDLKSIMHYRPMAFSKNGKRTIDSIANPGMNFGVSTSMTEIDIEQVVALYKDTRLTVPPTPPTPKPTTAKPTPKPTKKPTKAPTEEPLGVCAAHEAKQACNEQRPMCHWRKSQCIARCGKIDSEELCDAQESTCSWRSNKAKCGRRKRRRRMRFG